MKHNYSITYKRVHLRPLEEKDIEELRLLRNKLQVYFNSTAQISPEQQKAWYDRYLTKDDDVMFAVELVEKPGVFIGAVATYDIDWENGVGTGGRTVVDKEKAPEKGIGTELAFAHGSITFGAMGLKKLCCTVHKDNTIAIKMNYRTGNKIVGEIGDEYQMEVTKEDFFAILDQC